MTNKHFFEEPDQDDNNITIQNSIYKFTKCEVVFLPPNQIDIAIIRMKENYKDYPSLTAMKISKSPVTLLETVYAINFSYFDLTDILKIKEPFQFVNL
jgi:hypothetical protein